MNYQAIEILRKMPLNERFLYNGYTYNEVKERVANMPENCKKWYLENVRKVIVLQVVQMNLHEVESLKNTNFNIINSLQTK
jgi:hypothetical protein